MNVTSRSQNNCDYVPLAWPGGMVGGQRSGGVGAGWIGTGRGEVAKGRMITGFRPSPLLG